MRGIAALASGCLFAILTIASAHAVEPDAPQRLISDTEAYGITIRQRLFDPEREYSKEDKVDREALAEAYIARDHKPIWLTENGLIANAHKLADAFKRADDWGLQSADFSLPERLQDLRREDEKIEAEIALSLAVLKYARHARGGRIAKPSKELSSYLDRRPNLIAPSEVINSVVTTSDPAAYLESLHPKHEQFGRLRQQLLALRSGAAEEDAPVLLPSKGPTLGLGRTHADVALLRQRLEIDEDVEDPKVFDDTVLAAVKTFQKDNGLSVDGLVGRGTRRALNGDYVAPPSEEMLIANMEAWRWMPDELGEKYIFVNIPEYHVHVVKNDTVIHRERVIVGKYKNQTPVFSDTLETIVIHPHWGVPNSIKVNEILPRLARGQSLARQGLRIQRNGRDINANAIDWSRADIRNYHVYQPPGRGNALGAVKFMFPNKHAVYLHDTPMKHLFNSRARTFSHGCIRLRNPKRMAEVLLEEDKGWQSSQVQTMFRSGPQNNQIKVDEPFAVHVGYFTAWVDDDGNLKSWRDIYGHEKRIKLALAGKHHLIKRHADHLKPVKYDRQKIARIRESYGNNNPTNFLQLLFGNF